MPVITAHGLGGGGSMYCPRISPWASPPDLLFVSCDLTGLYRSENGGGTWTLLDGRKVQGWFRFSVAFDPANPGHIVAFHPAFGLQESTSYGAEGTWMPLSPMNTTQPQITAAGFFRDGTILLIGTAQGIYRIDMTVSSSSRVWTPVTATDLTGTNATITDVFGFVFPPGTLPTHCFTATVDDIFWSPDKGMTWKQVTGNLPLPATSGPYIPPERTIDAATYTASKIRGFAGGANAQYVALYATVRTDLNATTFTGGVYRCEIIGSPTQPSGLVWSSVSTGLNTQKATSTDSFSPTWSLYEHLGVADGEPDTVYVTVINSADYNKSPFWAVYRGQYSNGQVNWSGIYDGFQSHADKNVDPGWIGEDSPAGLGWGFGGPATGFIVDPRTSNRAMYTNHAVVDIMLNWSVQNRWEQKYSTMVAPASASNPARWKTRGLDVTTTWQYYVHPTKNNIHFISSTDIGLARSFDGGETWSSVVYSDITGAYKGTKQGNCYELAFLGGAIFAAVSEQHDIPHGTQLKVTGKHGSILKSTNDGQTWTTVAGATSNDGGSKWTPDTQSGLGDGPVVSIVYDDSNKVLYTAVWEKGVYWSTIAGTQWFKLGEFDPAIYPHADPRCHRLQYKNGDLYCLVAAQYTGRDNTGNPVPPLTKGVLYRLKKADMAPPIGGSSGTFPVTAQWENLTKNLGAAGIISPTDFAFDPTSPNTLLLCSESAVSGGEGGLYWTRDASATPPTWQTEPGVMPSNPNLLPLAKVKDYHPDSLQAFAPCIVSNRLYVTTLYNGIHTTAYDDTDPNWWPQWTEYKAIPFVGAQRITTSVDTQTGLAPFYITTFGAGAWEVQRQTYIIADHNTISRYEVEAVLSVSSPGPIDKVFYLVFDGFLAAEIGITSIPPAGQAPTIFPQVVLTGKNGTAPGVTAVATSLVAEDATLLDLPQRLTYTYRLQFTDTRAFFDSQSGAKIEDQPISLTVTQGAYGCKGQLMFIQPQNPYMLDGPTPWFSTDLRVFRILEGEQKYGALTKIGSTAPNALTWLQGLLAQYNSQNGAASPDFATIETDYTKSWLELAQSPFDPVSMTPKKVFNFAIAQVRYRSSSADATDVRVFFRLCTTALTGLDYHKATTYRTGTNPSGDPIPLLGLSNGEVSTIPCFAEPRKTDKTQGSLAMTQQTDTTNTQNILHGGGAEVFRYYGAFLDINQPEKQFPRRPGVQGDGPYDLATVFTVQDVMNSRHQCLIAELNYAKDAISEGDTPGSSDNLSQRNLVLSKSDNPGNAASHTVQHTFEIRATELGLREGSTLNAATNDELLIWWGDLPAPTRATLYLSNIDVDEVLALDRRRQSLSGLERVDAHTLRCRVDSLTYVPLPPTLSNIAGLITLELPDSVRYGQHFHILVQQCSAPDRVIVGAFEFAIPVMKASKILLDEENTLAVMRHITRSVPEGSHWAPVLQRYVAQLAAHVDGLGGDAASILPSPYGAPSDRNRYGRFGRRIRQLLFWLWHRRIALVLVLAVCVVAFLLRKWLKGTDWSL